jgi:hypothetical protein
VAVYLGGFDKSGGLVPLLYLAERQRPKPPNLNLNGSQSGGRIPCGGSKCSSNARLRGQHLFFRLPGLATLQALHQSPSPHSDAAKGRFMNWFFSQTAAPTNPNWWLHLIATSLFTSSE